ncbi:MAG: hypothetical protein ILO42_06305 [Clostridia bacterium]|nr:hypothetical protein [Clostridia bacterium]
MRDRKPAFVNSIATAFLAYFATIPVHELFHLLTHMIYGSKLICYSAGAVDAAVADYGVFSPFHRIMLAGGSASILNVIIAVILTVVLLKVKTGPTARMFLTQLMGMQAVEGFGYFLFGGLFGIGDWGNVYSVLTEYPGLITALRITLSVIGAVGIVGLFFFLNYLSYYFIEDKENKKERIRVAFILYLIPLIIGFSLGMIVSAVSPAVKSGALTMGECVLFNFMWIPFFWGFMFTGVMKTLPPKKEIFRYKLPEKPDFALLAIGIVLILVDVFVFGPGIWFN